MMAKPGANLHERSRVELLEEYVAYRFIARGNTLLGMLSLSAKKLSTENREYSNRRFRKGRRARRRAFQQTG
ncbi:hypothetical protein [Burkholderia ubonensis]|uniref:hypothetical protein n=1 Tax=Burkholderia ubonensis TaxID=101571 RepID=UPI0018DF399F|nr:hypothetical protein [Burkholderia ubonensis]